MKFFDRDSTLLFTVGTVAVAAWVAFRLYTGITLEDALITYRYAQNLALGNGFVFNPGEYVQGTTTPLLTLILGCLGWIFGAANIPLLSNIFIFAVSLGSGLFTFWGLRALNISRDTAALTICVFYFNPLTMWTTTGGMETPFVIFLMSIGFWSIATKRFSMAAYVSALLVLTRIDGVFWSAGIFLLILLEDRKAFLKAVIIGLLVVTPWLLFAHYYFGSVIPHTVVAKHLIGNETTLSLSGFLSEARWFANRFGASVPFEPVIGVILFLTGAAFLFRKSKHLLLRWLVIYPFVFALAFYFGRAPRFPWYFVPVAWSTLIIGMIGLFELWQRVCAKVKLNSRIVTSILISLYFIGVIASSVMAAGLHRDYQTNEDGLRKKLGLWLKDNTPKNAVVAMEAIGYQGYYSQRRVIDLAGLVSPAVVDIRKRQTNNAHAFAEICSQLKPDYIILRSYEYQENEHFHGGRLFLNDQQKAQFNQDYSPVREFIAPIPEVWGRLSRLTVFERTKK